MKEESIMKKMICFRFSLCPFLLLLWGCGSARTAAEKEKLAWEVREAVEGASFTFDATYVYPTSYKPLYLSPYYDVVVTPDTIKAYLPYYGRAYRAPMDPREGGFQFTSSDFTYRYAPGSHKGSWMVKMTILDLDRPVTFSFDIWENGSSRLMVNDFNRQPIWFQGDISRKTAK